MGHMRADLRIWLARALLILGLAPLCGIAVLAVRSCTLERASRHAGPAGPRHLSRAIATRARAAESGQVGHLEIARLGLHAPIVEGIDRDELLVGVGHVPGTAFPGEADNSALAGHRDTHLAALRNVREGDRIRIETPDGVFLYDVDSSFVVTPDRGDLLRPTGRAMLTLVTCYPFHWIGPAPKRFIVRAHEVRAGEAARGDAAATPAPASGGQTAAR
jgi:LPXTG-site transpeptidase (sortase) family protein